MKLFETVSLLSVHFSKSRLRAAFLLVRATDRLEPIQMQMPGGHLPSAGWTADALYCNRVLSPHISPSGNGLEGFTA